MFPPGLLTVPQNEGSGSHCVLWVQQSVERREERCFHFSGFCKSETLEIRSLLSQKLQKARCRPCAKRCLPPSAIRHPPSVIRPVWVKHDETVAPRAEDTANPSSKTVEHTQVLEGKMQKGANQGESLGSTEESNVGRNVKGAEQKPSGRPRSSWTDSEIRVFLQEWEVIEHEAGHPGRKMHKKTKFLCQRLYHRGLKKSWKSCFHLLRNLQDLHRTLCNERPGIEPLFSPYAEALYRILGSSPQESWFPGPLYDGAGDSMLPVYPQPPRYQPSDYGITVPSAQLQGNPLPMMAQEDPPFPTWEPWNPSYPLSVPHLLPGFVPEDPSLQQPWSTCNLQQDPQ
ncbi:putative uncharacterized protein MSANTD5 [Apodemus sylvaticus]|uniref:putative uncharacterized protein MSANTD5 n=1 Tax=Apodemus sylvaticus TaxID=10129 RepID=UPI00224287D2|nr:putative uncharacterized protein MSANTD5 [Apodemus sylvaticus]